MGEIATTFNSDESDHDEEDESDYDDNHDDSDDDDDDDDDSEGGKNIPFWKEHFLAIIIALFASIGAHCYNEINNSPPKSLKVSRMSNISFCPLEPHHSKINDRLYPLEFFIPRDRFESLGEFYIADMIDLSIKTKEEQRVALMGHAQFQCLIEQHQSKSNDVKVKGNTYFYKEPSLAEIYPELTDQEKGSRPVKSPSNSLINSSKERRRNLQQPPLSFTGFAAKFVNMNDKPVLLFWDGKGRNENSKKLVGEIPPMESIGTATMAGHGFHITPIYDPSMVLKRWVLTPDVALVFYEPKGLLVDNPILYAMYQKQLLNQAFARDYTVASGRTWLANFPRSFPVHHMQKASYIGQEHHVGDMTLSVISVAPRVFRINDFLSPGECKEVIRLGLEEGLEQSALHSNLLARQNKDNSTRSSTNAWLSRDTSPLLKSIYQKAATLTKINSKLFQEFYSLKAEHRSIAESLQVVRYKEGEEYIPHHDFVSPPINDHYQPSRFATLLIYLNDVQQGGETRFPRAVNNYNAEGLEVTPRAGRAILFYNMLEDGNFDDLSQHGGNKVLKGNKWLANLWIWDPVIG